LTLVYICGRKEGQDQVHLGMVELQVGHSRGWLIWKCFRPFRTRLDCYRELHFGVYNWSCESSDAFDVGPCYQQCVL